MREQFYEDVVGSGLTDESRGNILAYHQEFYDHPELSLPPENEREMTEQEGQVIDIVRDIGGDVARSYGAEGFNVRRNNFHLIPEQNWPRDLGSACGGFNTESQQLTIREPGSLLSLAHVSFHELMHIQSHGKLQITTGGILDDYRTGFGMSDRAGDKDYFNLINEAITEELARSFVERVRGFPIMAEEAKATESLKSTHHDLKNSDGSPFFSREMYFAAIAENEDGETIMKGENFAYKVEREALSALIDKVSERAGSNTLLPVEVWTMFTKGYFTGNVMPIGRTIDQTFGKGTFRKIGEINDPESLLKFVDSL